MGKFKSKLGCVTSLFTCFGSVGKKKKIKKQRKNVSAIPESPEKTANGQQQQHDLEDHYDDVGRSPTADNIGGGVVVSHLKNDRGILVNGHSDSGSSHNYGGTEEKKRVSIIQREKDVRSTNHHLLLPQSPRSDSMRSMGSAVSKQSSVYYDASDDNYDIENDDINYQDNSNDDSFFDDTLQIDGQYFFSAMDDPTISQEAFDGIRLYPPLPTTCPDPIPRSPISMANIQTLLHDYQHQADTASTKVLNDEADISASQAGIALELQAKRLLSLKDDAPIDYMDKYTHQLLEELKTSNVREKGFPGELSAMELEAVQRFQHELQTRTDRTYHQIVHSFREVESEAYALCRFLRARQFNVEKVFDLLDVAKEYFVVAKAANFYPDLEKDMGVSRSVFLSQYPAVFCGK